MMPADTTIRPAASADLGAISALHAQVFGPGRFARTAYRLRESTKPISRHCLVAESAGDIVGAVRFTSITIGGEGWALLLGPIVIAPHRTDQGIGRELIRRGLDAAKAAGNALVILVGDSGYYGRLGFVAVPPGQILLPGPVDLTRLLAHEFRDGALADYRGLVTAAPSTSLD